ncbi:hypothetical protein J4P02_01475 [Pseudomonas sp. NFXW11]|uniref:hypothetical protein n=1 Tax=Pseudomonas sp. NFXW11 TaxID=2819531 RepID=UPI003CF8105B
MLLSKAVSTVKILVSPVIDLARKSDIRELMARLGMLPGCLSLGLVQSNDDQELWELRSQWASQECMHHYFFAEDLADLVQILVGYCREMQFSTSLDTGENCK